jgi:hypothetical protein
MRAPKTFAIAFVACALAVSTSTARAQSRCAGRDGHWADLRLADDLPATVEPGKLLSLLRGRLASSGLGLCFRETPPAAPATLVVQMRPDGASVVAIDVVSARDGQPGIRGSVDLRTIPSDGHTLAVATIAHEIVRGALDRAPPPPATPPAATGRSYELAVALTGSTSSGGLADWGPDLEAGVGILRWLTVRARLGYRLVGDTSAPHGTVAADAFVAGIGLRQSLLSWPRVGLGVYQRVDLVRVRFSPRAAPGDLSSPASLNALVASAGLAVGLRIGGPVSIVVAGGPCWAPMGARARDDGRGVVALDGLGGELMAGLAMEL